MRRSELSHSFEGPRLLGCIKVEVRKSLSEPIFRQKSEKSALRRCLASLAARERLIGPFPVRFVEPLRHEPNLRGATELSGPGERCGAILQRIWPHQGHQPQKRLWICCKLCDYLCIMSVCVRARQKACVACPLVY